MTLPPPDPLDTSPLTDDDLTVDAVADGTATPAQRARVDASTSLQERVALLVALRARLAAPTTPLSVVAADDMIRVAVATAPRDHRGEESATDNGQGAPPSRRRPDRTPWLVAAAILLLLALGAVTVPRLTGDRTSSSDAASSAAAVTSTNASSSPGSNDGADSAPAVESAAAAKDHDTEDLFATAPLLSLGEVATVAELVERAMAALDGTTGRATAPLADPGTTTDAVGRACLASLASDAVVELVADGRIDAVDHLVIITALPGSDQPTRAVEVVRSSDCLVVDRSLR